MNQNQWSPHAAALMAYHEGNHDAKIVVYDDFAGRDEHPVSYFFREPAEFPLVERVALDLCRGRVLDVGAGSGCHSLVLQDRGLTVVALESVPELVTILGERGVRNVREGDIFAFSDGPFDTVLLMMNGLGIAETLEGLDRLFVHLHSLVTPQGQIVADSTDLRDRAPAGVTTREDGRYLGEIAVQLEFAGNRGPVFPQLYVDPDTLATHAERTGWVMTVVARGEAGTYLARLVPDPCATGG